MVVEGNWASATKSLHISNGSLQKRRKRFSVVFPRIPWWYIKKRNSNNSNAYLFRS